MVRSLRIYGTLISAIGHLEKVLGVLLITAIVLTIAFQVFTRYVFNYPIVWVEELAGYAFVWATFLGASYGLKKGRHIRIQTFVDRLGERPRAAMALLVYAAMAIVLVTLIKYGMIVGRIEARSTSVALPLAVPRNWFYTMPLILASASMLITLGYLALRAVYHLLHGVEAALGRRVP